MTGGRKSWSCREWASSGWDCRLGVGPWVQDSSQMPKKAMQFAGSRSGHSVLPAVRGDGGVSHCPSLQYLEPGGSVQESKMARIINKPSQQWPRVFPWSSSSLGTASCCFLGGVLPGTFRVYRTSLSFSFLFFVSLRFSVSSFFQFPGIYTNYSIVPSNNSGS